MRQLLTILPIFLLLISCTKEAKKPLVVPLKKEEQLKSGVLKNDLPVEKGVIPKGTDIGVLDKKLHLVYDNKDFPLNFRIKGMLMDNRFPVYFHLTDEKRKLKCGILVEDTIYNGEKFPAHTGINLDENGKVIYLGGTYEKHLKQERVDLSKIYFGRRIVDQDAKIDSESEITGNGCIINNIISKDGLNLHGVTWIENTKIELKLYPDGLAYPEKIFARKGQELRGHKLEKDSILQYCWDRKLKQAVIEYETEGTYDDFISVGSAGQTCQWSITNIQE